MLMHWIWLATRPSLNEQQKLAVLSAFRDAEAVYFAEKEAYESITGLTAVGVDALLDKDLTQAQDILDECIKHDIHVCTFYDGAYPIRLKNIIDPPLVLYYQGNLSGLDNSPMIGIVGTRKASAYGLNTATRMGYQIARCGGIVASGMAKGVDSNAMIGALTGGGKIVGVLGCGINVIYPANNRSLYLDTARNGCLISEFPPGTPPYKWNFPKRNRIISGLSNGVLVVEAPKISGALITARCAGDQGRDVFVVPGNIGVPTLEGSNALLREGAIAVSCGWDIISEYQSMYPEKVCQRTEEPLTLRHSEPIQPMVAQKTAIPRAKKTSFDRKKVEKPVDNQQKTSYSVQQDVLRQLSEEEKELLKPLQQGEMLADDLIAASGLPAGKVLSMLTILQIRGVVELLPGKRVKFK